MRNKARGEVWKVWLYAVAAVALGAWMSPLLYDAGKALDEVSANKTTNGPLEWLGAACRTADFPQFYQAGLLLAAGVLFFPWLEWLHAKPGVPVTGGAGPWLPRPEEETNAPSRGQPLRHHPRGWWHGCAGFLLVAGPWLALGMVLVKAGVFIPLHPAGGWAVFALRTGATSLALALVLEGFFRGLAMGVFLRAMRPPAALGMTAAFFALVLSVMPPPGVNVADPEAAGTGFEMLGLVATRFADWQDVCGTLRAAARSGRGVSLRPLADGFALVAHRLAHGMAFRRKPCPASWPRHPARNASSLSGNLLHQGVIPLIVIVLAGVLAHDLIPTPRDEPPTQS